jgi:hypothetical protein
MSVQTSIRARFEAAEPLSDFIARAVANHDLWVMTDKRAALSPEAEARAAAIPCRWQLLVLLEDWCGDAVNSVPVIQRIADANPGIELRVLERDRNLDLMDTHLTNGARAIPLVILYDADFNERGQWGSRPAPLQQWVLEHGLQLEKDKRYKQVRTWYVRDRGATIADEVLTLLEQCAAAEVLTQGGDTAEAAADAGGPETAQVAGSSPL